MDNLEDWFKAGIDGVGIGSTLVKTDIDTQEELDEIAVKARQLVEFTKEIWTHYRLKE